MIIKLIISFVLLTLILWGLFEAVRYAFVKAKVSPKFARNFMLGSSIIAVSGVILFFVSQLF